MTTPAVPSRSGAPYHPAGDDPGATAPRRLRGADPAALLDAASKGDRVALARLLTLVEGGGAPGRAVAALAYRSGREAQTVGMTGPPGAGKSTLVDRIIATARDQRRRRSSVSSRSTPRRRSPAAPSWATGSGCRTTPSTPGCSSGRWRLGGTSAGSPSPSPRRSGPWRPPGSPSCSWRPSASARSRSRWPGPPTPRSWSSTLDGVTPSRPTRRGSSRSPTSS